jgi:HAD superfamily hydrolase (TIGR01484 family)
MQLYKSYIQEKLHINHDTKKCFIFDLDGTLIFNGIPLSKNSEDILKKIIDHGHEIIIATGRSKFDANLVLPKWCHNLSMSLFSGGLSISSDNKILRDIYLSKITSIEITDMCLKNDLPFMIDGLSHYYHAPVDHARFAKIPGFDPVFRREPDLDRLLKTNIYKILVLDLEVHDEFVSYAATKDLIIKHHSYDACFDIVPNHCCKYEGVLPLINDYKHEDVFVFGNDFNDYEMLLNFKNSILFGNIKQLQNIAAINILYDHDTLPNFEQVINTILN